MPWGPLRRPKSFLAGDFSPAGSAKAQISARAPKPPNQFPEPPRPPRAALGRPSFLLQELSGGTHPRSPKPGPLPEPRLQPRRPRPAPRIPQRWWKAEEMTQKLLLQSQDFRARQSPRLPAGRRATNRSWGAPLVAPRGFRPAGGNCQPRTEKPSRSAAALKAAALRPGGARFRLPIPGHPRAPRGVPAPQKHTTLTSPFPAERATPKCRAPTSSRVHSSFHVGEPRGPAHPERRSPSTHRSPHPRRRPPPYLAKRPS